MGEQDAPHGRERGNAGLVGVDEAVIHGQAEQHLGCVLQVIRVKAVLKQRILASGLFKMCSVQRTRRHPSARRQLMSSE